MNYLYRPITHEDYGFTTKFYRVQFEGIAEWHLDSKIYLEMPRCGRNYLVFKCILKDNQGQNIGCMNFQENDDTIWLSYIEVNDNMRGKGIASLLLRYLESVTIRMNKSRIEGLFLSETNHVREFYNKNGYTLTPTKTKEYISKDLDIKKICDDYDNLFKIIEISNDEYYSRDINESEIELT